MFAFVSNANTERKSISKIFDFLCCSCLCAYLVLSLIVDSKLWNSKILKNNRCLAYNIDGTLNHIVYKSLFTFFSRIMFFNKYSLFRNVKWLKSYRKHYAHNGPCCGGGSGGVLTSESVRNLLRREPNTQERFMLQGWVREVNKSKLKSFVKVDDGTTVQQVQCVIPNELLSRYISHGFNKKLSLFSFQQAVSWFCHFSHGQVSQ